MKAYRKQIILSVSIILISVILYSIFANPVERGFPENELVLLSIKTMYAIFDLGVIIALFR